MARIAYYRCSSRDQSIAAQRDAMGGGFDMEFDDQGISGAVLAADRPGFARLLAYVRRGDSLHVFALDRLGRDALDVQGMVKRLIDDGISVEIHGLGPIAGDSGKLVVAVLAQLSEIERSKIALRCEAGRQLARKSLAITGKTHRGKTSLGRPKAHDATAVATWRRDNAASVSVTARHFGISTATVSRYCSA